MGVKEMMSRVKSFCNVSEWCFTFCITNKVCKICISNIFAFITVTSRQPTAKWAPLQYYITSVFGFYKCHVYKYMKKL